jgi:hypothetical protein
MTDAQTPPVPTTAQPKPKLTPAPKKAGSTPPTTAKPKLAPGTSSPPKTKPAAKPKKVPSKTGAVTAPAAVRGDSKFVGLDPDNTRKFADELAKFVADISPFSKQLLTIGADPKHQALAKASADTVTSWSYEVNRLADTLRRKADQIQGIKPTPTTTPPGFNPSPDTPLQTAIKTGDPDVIGAAIGEYAKDHSADEVQDYVARGFIGHEDLLDDIAKSKNGVSSWNKNGQQGFFRATITPEFIRAPKDVQLGVFDAYRRVPDAFALLVVDRKTYELMTDDSAGSIGTFLGPERLAEIVKVKLKPDNGVLYGTNPVVFETGGPASINRALKLLAAQATPALALRAAEIIGIDNLNNFLVATDYELLVSPNKEEEPAIRGALQAIGFLEGLASQDPKSKEKDSFFRTLIRDIPSRQLAMLVSTEGPRPQDATFDSRLLSDIGEKVLFDGSAETSSEPLTTGVLDGTAAHPLTPRELMLNAFLNNASKHADGQIPSSAVDHFIFSSSSHSRVEKVKVLLTEDLISFSTTMNDGYTTDAYRNSDLGARVFSTSVDKPFGHPVSPTSGDNYADDKWKVIKLFKELSENGKKFKGITPAGSYSLAHINSNMLAETDLKVFDANGNSIPFADAYAEDLMVSGSRISSDFDMNGPSTLQFLGLLGHSNPAGAELMAGLGRYAMRNGTAWKDDPTARKYLARLYGAVVGSVMKFEEGLEAQKRKDAEMSALFLSIIAGFVVMGTGGLAAGFIPAAGATVMGLQIGAKALQGIAAGGSQLTLDLVLTGISAYSGQDVGKRSKADTQQDMINLYATLTVPMTPAIKARPGIKAFTDPKTGKIYSPVVGAPHPMKPGKRITQEEVTDFYSVLYNDNMTPQQRAAAQEFAEAVVLQAMVKTA